jgi:hypothetical protein
MSDSFQLERFRIAQDTGATYERALSELRGGQKAGHWMWFVFPQLEGLGQSATSRRYAIRSLAEARCYLRDPVLGRRLLLMREDGARTGPGRVGAKRVFKPHRSGFDSGPLRSVGQVAVLRGWDRRRLRVLDPQQGDFGAA